MKIGHAKSYRVFVRNWWRNNPDWPDGLEPDPGARKHTIARRCTEDEARQLCREWNEAHKPGRLSRKAEYENEVIPPAAKGLSPVFDGTRRVAAGR